MPFVELKHTKCNLPMADEIQKHHAQPGSTFKCKDSGCDKVYVLTNDNSWVRVTTAYRTIGGDIIINGEDDEVDEYSGMTVEERNRLFKIREEEAAVALESSRTREFQRKIKTLEYKLNQLEEALLRETEKTWWDKLCGK